ncbi:MAG: hypothetical protein JRI68_16415 [Deltaproteobacteria bacterium]|nr:hypothetical protein [Deltaproteobacteria bacterium]
MSLRSMVPVATCALAAAVLITGCPEEQQGGAKPGAGSAKPAGSAQPAATGTSSQAAASGGTQGGALAITGTVKYTGEKFDMEVPPKRKKAEFCKDKDIKHNGVIFAKDNGLKDVFVAIADGQIKGDHKPQPAAIEMKDCMFVPRMMGAVAKQEITFKNSDPITFKIKASKGSADAFELELAKGADPAKKAFDAAGIYQVNAADHPWMRTLVVVTDNPYYAVTGADGSFKIEKVPAGKYKIIAWHALWGKKEQTVEVKGTAKIEIEYDGAEDEPEENKGELDDQFE